MSEWRSQRAGHGVTRAERGVLVRVRFGFFAEKFVGELARHVEMLGWSCSIFLLGNAEQCAVFANERG